MSDFGVGVSTLAAVVSAVGGALAAAAALRSAESARQAQRAVEESERRSAWREAAGVASEVVAEAGMIKELANDVRVAYRTLEGFTGMIGSSRAKFFKGRAQEKSKAADALASRAIDLSKAVDKLRTASVDDITRERVGVFDSLVQLRAMATDLRREHANIESQCALYREQTIK